MYAMVAMRLIPYGWKGTLLTNSFGVLELATPFAAQASTRNWKNEILLAVVAVSDSRVRPSRRNLRIRLCRSARPLARLFSKRERRSRGLPCSSPTGPIAQSALFFDGLFGQDSRGTSLRIPLRFCLLAQNTKPNGALIRSRGQKKNYESMDYSNSHSRQFRYFDRFNGCYGSVELDSPVPRGAQCWRYR